MKNDLLIFIEKTKEELIEEILQLRQENEKLRETLEGKEKSQAQKEFLKNLRLDQKVKHPKTPGQKAGHESLTRIKPNRQGFNIPRLALQ